MCNSTPRSLVVNGTTMLRFDGPLLIASADTTRTGRPPACTLPWSTRGGSANQTSPRDGFGTINQFASIHLRLGDCLLLGVPVLGISNQFGHTSAVWIQH